MADDGEDDDTPAAVADASSPAPSTAGSTPAPAPTAPAAPAKPAPDFDSMLVSPDKMAAVQQQLLAIKQREAAATASGASEVTSRLERDRQRMEDAYKATAIGPDDLKPYDAAGKSQQYSTDPVTAFGSIGSVFAMLASGFTRAPMEAALNGGAAAINAIHAQDDKAYQRDFDAWKQNTDLALKRHEIQRQAYNDATTLMNSDINAGRTKLEMNARTFGDQKALTLLENGMDKELIDLQDSRNKAALSLKQQWDQVELQHEKVSDLRNDPRYTSGDPAQKTAAIQDWTQRWSASGQQANKYTTIKSYVDQQKAAHPDYTPADVLKWQGEAADALDGGTGGSSGGLQEKRARELMQTDPEKFPTLNEAISEIQKRDRANKPLTGPQAEQAERKKYVDEVLSEGKLTGLAADQEADRRMRVANPPKMTAAQQGRYQDRVFLADETIPVIDKNLKRLQQYVGITGAAGYATRLGEKVGNVLGSDQVARQEFAKDIDLMRLNAARILTLSQGRPLAAEAARVNNIIKGISIGDVNKSTIAALQDYRKLVEDFKNDSAARLQGGGAGVGGVNPEGTGARTTAPPTTKPWERDPVVGPRSEALASDMAAG